MIASAVRKTPSRQADHSKKHLEEEGFVCPVQTCGLVFDREHGLTMHLINAHKSSLHGQNHERKQRRTGQTNTACLAHSSGMRLTVPRRLHGRGERLVCDRITSQLYRDENGDTERVNDEEQRLCSQNRIIYCDSRS